VLANAEAESQGSAKLLGLWGGIATNDRVADEVLIHAEDEAGHSRLFVQLTRSAFPALLDRVHTLALQEQLTKVNRPSLRKTQALDETMVVDHLVQMNIGEIRTRAHMHLLGPAVLAATSAERQPWVEKTLQRLGGDEVRHIGYTARLMEAWCRDGLAGRIATLYARRLQEFSIMTIHQTEAAVRSYANGCFPDLLEI
jgi:hypothetical protein